MAAMKSLILLSIVAACAVEPEQPTSTSESSEVVAPTAMSIQEVKKLMETNPPPQLNLAPPATTESSVCVQQTCFRYRAFSTDDPNFGVTYWVGPNGWQANQSCLSSCGSSAFCPEMLDFQEEAMFSAAAAHCGGCGPGQLCLPVPSAVYGYCNTQTVVALSEIHCQYNGGGGSGDPTNGGER
jgi:hypothetical protein